MCLVMAVFAWFTIYETLLLSVHRAEDDNMGRRRPNDKSAYLSLKEIRDRKAG